MGPRAQRHPRRVSVSISTWRWCAVTGFLVLGAFSCADGTGEGGGGGEDAGPTGGAPGCRLPPALSGDDLVRLTEPPWTGPILLSHEGELRHVSYLSLDAGGAARWIAFSTDSFMRGTATWEIDGDKVIVSVDSEESSWPTLQPPEPTSVTLERIDARKVVAHLDGTSGPIDEVWIPGGLCDDACAGGPAFPCAVDFETLWDP